MSDIKLMIPKLDHEDAYFFFWWVEDGREAYIAYVHILGRLLSTRLCAERLIGLSVL